MPIILLPTEAVADLLPFDNNSGNSTFRSGGFVNPFEVKKVWIRRASRSARLTESEQKEVDEFLAKHKSMLSVDVSLTDFPDAIWRAVLQEANLPQSIRTKIALHVFGMRSSDCAIDEIYQVEVSDLVEFGTTLQMVGDSSPNCEFSLNGRWYPVIVTIKFLEDSEKKTKGAQIGCQLSLGEKSFSVSELLLPSMFTSETGNLQTYSVLEVLERFGYRRLQTSPAEFNLRLVKAERAATESGRVVLVTNSVVVDARYSWWRGFEIQALGTPETPSRCVKESALEIEEDGRYYYGHMINEQESRSRLPFVRVFCLETKSYVYADVDDVEPYEFDTDALANLHLPSDMHSVLRRVFETPVENMFGDLLRGKHGGAVILAAGEPGVGKTLTAEIYAEISERPLYVLELGELGTNANEVEENLQRVFARVTRWNAVLQFDECEIFLAERGTDLERSAIVGIFLRLLDYYRGLLFLTTNRPGDLDAAVISRVMLRLEYPPLNAETRAKIWQTMFSVAALNLTEVKFEELGDIKVNGRQIRNMTRLARILFPDGTVNGKGMQEVLRYGSGVAAVYSNGMLTTSGEFHD